MSTRFPAKEAMLFFLITSQQAAPMQRFGVSDNDAFLFFLKHMRDPVHHCLNPLSMHTVAADFGWSDIGTWGSLYTHAVHDAEANAVNGKAVLVDTRNSVVNIEPGYEAVVQGLDHCLVALRDHSLLVCHLDDEQQIKHWVEKL